MKISVIIPTYKPQDYLWQCLDSLYRQSFSKADYEVILVLNGCHEPWFSDIQKFIADHMQGVCVNFLHTNEPGVSNARNLALDYAKGEYITFIDDDDYVSVDYLSELYTIATRNTIALAYPYVFDDGKEGIQKNHSITNVYNKLCTCRASHYFKAKEYFSGPWMKLIPQAMINSRRFDKKLHNGEDSVFLFQISDKYGLVATASKKAVYYRRYRKDSAVTRKHRRMYVIKNSFYMIWCYVKCYVARPYKYNFLFFITRIMGALRVMINGIV